jgi:hypothetical protein
MEIHNLQEKCYVKKINEICGKKVSASTMYRELEKLGYSRLGRSIINREDLKKEHFDS